MPLINREANWPDDIFVQISESQLGRAIRTKRWKYGVDAPEKDSWHDMSSDSYVEQYLYDLESDPYELCNLVNHESHEEVLVVMRERLKRRMREAGETEPLIKASPMPKIVQFQRKVFQGEAYQ